MIYNNNFMSSKLSVQQNGTMQHDNRTSDNVKISFAQVTFILFFLSNKKLVEDQIVNLLYFKLCKK